MKKPIIIATDDDPQVLRAIERDLRKAYRKEYRILSTASAKEALEVVDQLKEKGEVIALFVSDQRMPEMLGVEFLAQARKVYPEAKKVLLTAYSDTNAAIQAINDVQLDYYLMKPWDPPEEKLYPVLDELLKDWHLSYRPDFEGIRIMGYQFSPQSHLLKDFLAGNLIPFQWIDVENSEKAPELIERHQLKATDYPTVFFEDGSVEKAPGILELGERLGLQNKASQRMYDVTIVGAGPAGLAAAVYGASEGLKTLLVEKRAPGGQAGTSSRIENYLGFPSGLSGAELSRRAITQATRLGSEFLTPQEVVSIEIVEGGYKLITFADGTTINSRAIVITTGVNYRQLDAPGMDKFTGAGIYYGAATTEANSCRGGDVYIVGGGNSAGQAAMYLSKFAANVHIVIRKPDLTSSMSHYLIEQIEHTPNIHLQPCTVVTEALGDDRLSGLKLQHVDGTDEREVPALALFVFIGAKPYTDWLGDLVLKNDKGFIETGRELTKYESFASQWKKNREPFLLETNQPGIFAAGDVRAGAMNRVASAVGEGSMSIKMVHEYLAE